MISNNASSNLKGFTLIELLVAFAVMSVTLSLSYPAYRSFQNQSLVDNFTKEVVQFFRQAQNNAIAVKDPNCKDYTAWGLSARAFEAWTVVVFADRLELTKACLARLSGFPIRYLEITNASNPPISKLSFPPRVITNNTGLAYCFLPPFGNPATHGAAISGNIVLSSQACIQFAPSFPTVATLTVTHSPSNKQRKVCISYNRIYDIPATQACS